MNTYVELDPRAGSATIDAAIASWVEAPAVVLRLRADGGGPAEFGEPFLRVVKATCRRSEGQVVVGGLDCADAILGRGVESLDFSNWRFGGPVSFANAVFLGGRLLFDGAQFTDVGDATFAGAVFASEIASFDRATFLGNTVSFDDAMFASQSTSFENVGFRCDYQSFERASFVSGSISFSNAEFGGEWVGFDHSSFLCDDVSFSEALFGSRIASFVGAEFLADRTSFQSAGFRGRLQARHLTASHLDLRAIELHERVDVSGVLGRLDLSDAWLHADVHLQVAGSLDLSRGKVRGSLIVEGLAESHLTDRDDNVRSQRDELLPGWLGAGVELDSLAGADLAGPVRLGDRVAVTWTQWQDTDLTRVSISDAESFLRAPFSGRRAVALEHTWRTSAGLLQKAWRNTREQHAPHQPAPQTAPWESLEHTYRDLRRSLEAGSNAPAASDFYYGEMEARRKRAAFRSRDKYILSAYWFVSGYGTVAWRALATFLAAITIATLSLRYGGVDIEYRGETVDFWETWLFSLRSSVSLLNAPSAPALTRGEQVIEILLRLIGPVLFALFALSLRSRIKR